MSDVVAILGMHRNGTSSVAGTLMKIGGASPRHLTQDDAYNERGYFESYVLVPLNDEILASAGTTWDDWREFNPDWYRSEQVDHFRRRAREAFELEFQNAPLAVTKDPRSCRFFPFWRHVYEEMGLRTRVVIPVRSPWDTAASLHYRDGMPIAKGVLLWLRHVLDAEADSRDLPRSIFTWEEFLTDWRATCAKISLDAEIAWPRLSDRSGAEVDRFLSRDLRHHSSGKEACDKLQPLNPWAFEAYQAMKELARDPKSVNAQATLSEVREALNFNGRVFGRVLIEYELTVEDSMRKLAVSKSDLGSQAQALAESAGKINDLQAALAASDEHCQQLTAELVEVRKRSERMLEEAAKATDALHRDCNRLHTLLEEAELERTEAHLAMTKLRTQRDQLVQGHVKLEAELTEALHQRQLQEIRLEEQEQAIAGLREDTHKLQDENIDARAALAHVHRSQAISRFRPIARVSRKERRVARSLKVSGLFDAAYYRRQCDHFSGAADLTDAEAILHFIREGFSQGLKPNPFFDTRWYLKQNEDVLAAGINPLLHYHVHGWQEGRDPSPSFSTDSYLRANPDVKDAKIDPLQHFLQQDQDESRVCGDEDQSGKI